MSKSVWKVSPKVPLIGKLNPSTLKAHAIRAQQLREVAMSSLSQNPA